MRTGFVLNFKLRNSDRFGVMPLTETEAWDLYTALREVLELEKDFERSGYFSVERLVIVEDNYHAGV